ncbi:MAG: hypothetical protein PF495_07985 [Spirochaetales bacterium]|jgi:hypothetical protein|nr:hypothetical protein [Spirochaetales bacterium]
MRKIENAAIRTDKVSATLFLENRALKIKTSTGNIFDVISVFQPDRVNFELQATITAKNADKTFKSVFFGEIDIARSLYNCIQKPDRELFEISQEEEYQKNLGTAFEVIKKLTKNEDERILCAYKYTN